MKTKKPAVALLAAALMAALLAFVPGAKAAPPPPERGYIAVAVGTPDATTLHYQVNLPDPDKWGPGPYATVVDYSGYQPGITIYDGLRDRFRDAGYAVVGLNMRGTGCSGGKFDYFEPLQSRDGAEAIEWLARRPWSNGRIGMVGKSYPGITQLFVAAEQPPALKAIVPGHVFGDLYRDVPFPGGIMNVTFAGGWSAGRIVEQFSVGPPYSVQNNDQQCLRNQADHAPNPVFNPFVQAVQPQNNWDGPLFHERSPWYFADKIRAPMFLVESWQDEQVGSRATHLLERVDPALPWKFMASNGDHGEYYGEEMLPQILRFLSYHLKQEVPAADRREGESFEAALARYTGEDRVIINWENGAMGGRRAAWTETYATWPVPGLTPWRLHMTQDGKLSSQRPPPVPPGTKLDQLNARDYGPVDYAYTPVLGAQERGGYKLAGQLPDQTKGSWANRPPQGTFAEFTSAKLDEDKVLLGSASVDLWLSSTAPDTDIEVTLSEVRSDGKEVFVQQGWLRASHRMEDSALSNPLRPYQTHRAGDSAPLLPGTPTKLRVEVFPFGHVFRAGSQIRVAIAAPHVVPDLWGFAELPLPAVNTIYTKGEYASSVALPLVSGAAAKQPLPPCSLRNQPCR